VPEIYPMFAVFILKLENSGMQEQQWASRAFS
jgi:hypothetical protein